MTELDSFNHSDYEIVCKENPYHGIFRIYRYHIKHRLFKGGWSDIFLREVMERRPSAGVLPYDPIQDRVILIEQFRAGAFQHAVSPWLVEVVAGVIEHDELPDQLAYREAIEEAGCELTQLKLITDFFVSPGATNEYMHLFCGKVDATNIHGIHGLAHEHEDIRVINISADEAFSRLRKGEIKTGPALISLLWLEQNRQALRNEWS